MQKLIVFEEKELRHLIKEEVEAAVALVNAKHEAQKKSVSGYLTQQEAADMLQISLSTIQRLINQRHLVARKIGRRTLFLQSDIEKCVLTLNK